MDVIDLTGLIEEGMWLDNPWITPPTIEPVAKINGPGGFDAHRFTLSTILGTYLEASAHLLPNGETIDQVAPERFIRPACVIQLPDLQPRQAISAQDLQSAGPVPQPGEAVLVATGWDRRWNRPGFVEDGPFFKLDAMQWLLDHGAAIIGADLPSFDNPRAPEGVVRLLFDAGRLLLAPLINLRDAARLNTPHPWLVALPLKIKGVCGTPCRALLVKNR
jgi:kynurenine formamidase